MYRIENDHFFAVLGEEENRLYVNMKNPIDGSDVKLIINKTDEGIVVDIWAEKNETEWVEEPIASMYEFWENMTVGQEEEE